MSNITINLSLNDLEKILLDKNGELNVKFSEQVANGFAKKYLKSIVHDKVFEKFTKTCKAVVEEEITDAYINFRTQDYLTDRLRTLIDSYVEKAVQKAFEQRYNDIATEVSSKLIDDEKTIIYDYAKKIF